MENNKIGHVEEKVREAMEMGEKTIGGPCTTSWDAVKS